jgi:N-acetylmuramoyl-L-alanine amidase
LIKDLDKFGIDYSLVHDEDIDTALSVRTHRANNIYFRKRNAIFLSIHSNSGKGSGFEIFTSPGDTKSDKVAQIFCETYMKFFPQFPFRSDISDKDLDKEENFQVLRETACPALLVENLFFDNRKEADLLLSVDFQTKMKNCILHCIQAVEDMKPI